MDGQNSLGMGGLGSENDEMFGGLSPLEFRYPESNSINLDLDANYLLDNPSGTSFHPSTDVLPDQTVVHDGDISAAQADEFRLSDQERTILNSSSIPDQGRTGISFTNLLIQGINSEEVPSQEMIGTSCTNFLTPVTNPLTVPGQDMSELGYSNFPTQNINSSNLHNPEISMMNLSNFPTQVTYVNTLEFHNQGSSSRDTFGIPTQESFTNILEFPNQNLSRTNALSFSAPHLASIGFLSHEQNMNTSWFPYQPQPMFMPTENNLGTTEVITISSSDDEQFQEGFNPNYGNDNGASGSNSNLPLRQTISKEMISQYFHMPINGAATALNIGVTVLKIRCRELGFSRWPQRKLKSIQAIISHLQEFGESSGIMIEGSVQERIIRLENERRQIEDTPDLPLEDDTKRLRQAIYKSSHRKIK